MQRQRGDKSLCRYDLVLFLLIRTEGLTVAEKSRYTAGFLASYL